MNSKYGLVRCLGSALDIDDLDLVPMFTDYDKNPHKYLDAWEKELRKRKLWDAVPEAIPSESPGNK